MDPSLADLPREVQEAMAGAGLMPASEQLVSAERAAAFGVAIAKMRDEAIAARSSSGIEQVMMLAEEAYLGIDDVNRAEFAGQAWTKGVGLGDGLRSAEVDQRSVTATGFVRLTSRYVDAAAAKACEISLPVDGKPFVLRATPVPEIVGALDSKIPVAMGGRPMLRAVQPGENPQQSGQQTAQVTVADLAKHQQQIAETAAEKAGDRIRDWLVEGGHIRHMRRVVFDGARLGVGVLKGPVTVERKGLAVRKVKGPMAAGASAVSVEMVMALAPATEWVDPWNIYPDPACGEDIHDGDYLFERSFVPPGKLSQFKRGGGYLSEAIDKVLGEGPDKAYVAASSNTGQARKSEKQFTMWQFWGRVKASDLETVNQLEASALSPGQEHVWAQVTLVNDTVIKCAVSMLSTSQSFPMHVFQWRRRAGHWIGVGIGEQLKFPQQMVNAGTRRLLTNAGNSSGSQIVINTDMLIPADGSMVMTPDKVWTPADGAFIEDIRKAFFAFEVPNRTPELLKLIEYALKVAEESTNIPLVTQGQSGKTTPETFGGQVLQDNNANQLLRDIGFSIAEQITNPVVTQMYEYLLADPDVPDEEKGDFHCDVSGAMAMVEKAIQDQAILMLGPMVSNPAFELSPKRWMEVLLRSKRLNPADLQMTEQEKKEASANASPPPPIAVAQINAQSREKVAETQAQLTAEKIKVDTDRDTAYTQALQRRDDNQHTAKMSELALSRELAMLDYANKRQISLEQVKSELAGLAMKLRTTKELAAFNAHVAQHDRHSGRALTASDEMTTPPTEVPGKAPDGQSYEA